ncbi:1041_t:CDS:2 [Cetraspora pellucida]|uniref:1041_t:CDS:1 n=1 Tax=Cetraspora pellucida TaxID=1433469 RepID=A0A9N9ES98_9GLOM|nr:1041_t:CDS:2 [Cetraspora pellucida]
MSNYGTPMEIDVPAGSKASGSGKAKDSSKKRFEVKKVLTDLLFTDGMP